MKVLIVQNVTREGPGLLEAILKESNIDYDLVDLDKAEEFPDPTNYQALVVLGGPDSANDQTSKMLQELTQIKKAVDAKIPYLGTCLGMQTLTKASGGEVFPSDVQEIGLRDPNGNFFEIELTNEGRNDPLFENVIPPLKILHLHGETVRLPSEAKLLATGKFCHNQVVKIGNNAYGLQGHFEVTKQILQTWLDQDPDLQKLDREGVEKDFIQVQDEYTHSGRTILTNFLKIAGLT